MSAEKGYLKGVWMLTGALVNNPVQAFGDIARGMGAELDKAEGFITPETILTYGGAGLALTGILAPALWPVTLVGVGLSAAGIGRYRAEGADERLEAERLRLLAEWPKTEAVIRDLEERFGPPLTPEEIEARKTAMTTKGPEPGQSLH